MPPPASATAGVNANKEMESDERMQSFFMAVPVCRVFGFAGPWFGPAHSLHPFFVASSM
jgi:hypothetical protein